MISLILISLAAILNAVMDVGQFHFSSSIFRNWNPKYYDGSISWKNKYVDWDGGDKRRKKWFFGLLNVPVQFTDAWHLVKSLMIICLVSAVIMYEPVFKNYQWIDFFLFGSVWNISFMLFYDVAFRFPKK